MTEDIKQKDQAAAFQDNAAHEAEAKAAETHEAAAKEHKEHAQTQTDRSKS